MTTTVNYGWTLPVVYGDTDAWGTFLNTNFTGIDTQVKATDTIAQAALPKAGGTMSGAIAMGTNKITGLGAATAATDVPQFGQVQSGVVMHSASVAGTVDAITAVMSPVTTSYVTNATYKVKSAGPNTVTAPTINIDGIGLKTIKKGASIALAAGDTGASGFEMELLYNGTDMLLKNPATLVGSADAVTITGNWTHTGSTTFAGATGGSWILNTSKTTGVAADVIGTGNFTGNNGSSASKTWAQIFSSIVTATAGAEVGNLVFATIQGGTVANRLVVANGVYTANATGGDKGIDTINSKGFYVDGAISAGKRFQSSPAAITLNSTVTLAHGLGAIPFNYQAYFKCVTTDAGYAVGDEISMASVSDASNSKGVIVAADATNLYIMVSSVAFQLLHKTTRTATALTTANWNLFAKANI